MNILFIEDESELLTTALAQLELLGHNVYPALDLAEARAILVDDTKPVDLVITDHRLPDGQGIQFAIEIKSSYPTTKSAIVSGCLTDRDIEKLAAHELMYFRKPLLYGKVVDAIRKHYAQLEQVAPPVVTEVVENETDQMPKDTVASSHVVSQPKKKFWGLFDRKDGK